MADIPFTHLHVHSQYSLLDGKATIQELVDKAIADGMRGIALTDHGNMFGCKEFYNYVKKKNGSLPPEQQFMPILGCEMYVAKGSMHEKKGKNSNSNHLIVLAKNKTGYKNLIKLVSKAWTEGQHYKPRTDRAELAKHKEGLIICSACLGGEIPQLILEGDLQEAEERVKWYKDTFGDDYYLELQRHETFKENANTETFPQQQRVNKELIEFGKKYGIKLVATNDVHFTNETDAEAHDRLICVSMQKSFSEPRMHYTKQEWLKTTAEMNKIFADIPEALTTTGEILSKIESYSIDHEPIMPFYEIPKEFGTEEEYRNRITEQELFDEFTQDEHGNVVLCKEEADKKIQRLGGYDKLYRIKFEADYLYKLTMEGAKKRYGDPIPPDILERLEFELYIMKTMGFPGYFLIVQDFINVGRNKLGVSVGPGRGSAAGSAAAYCLGITQIDPIKYDLLFERFLNPDRISLPDIDVDFDDDGRYEVLKYVTEKYGEEKVAHIITYQTMATKSAIKDVAKVMEVPLPEANRLAKLVVDRLPEVDGKSPKINFKNLLKYDAKFAAEKNNPDPKIREVMEYAEQLEGNIRGTGIHACGVIICRDDITDWVPVSMVTDADGSKLISTEYEGSVIEETGLIKMDFLGLKTLSIIKEVLTNIKNARGIDLDIDHIPLDDPKTFQLYCDGRTTATFQFESPGMQNSLRGLQPSKFEDLIAMNALYRPGPMDYIPSFIARKHGREPITYDIPIMEKYLKETYGITVYQEQVMLLSRLLANFTRGESDMLRKAMGKKQIDKMAKLKVKFMEEGQKNGHKPEVLEKIWADWEKFASYAFNKSHAACYSWVAYQTAYLKANYPAEYMAGVMSRNLSQSDKLKKIMDECKSMGLTVKGPDINESYEKFGVSKTGEIRFGLGAVKGVGGNAVNAIIAERQKNGPFKDIYDFVERVNLSACNRGSIENLAKAGTFDCFGMAREMFVAPVGDVSYTEQLVRYGQNIQNDRNSLQASLFGDLEPIETDRPPYPQFTPWSRMQRLEEEKNLVTVYLSAHPLDPYYMEITYGCNCKCGEYEERAEAGTTLSIAGMVTNFQEKMSKKGKPFGILTIEDFDGKAELRLFGKNYDTFKGRFVKGDTIYMRISHQVAQYNPNFTDVKFEAVEPLESKRGTLANGIRLLIGSDFENENFMKALSKFSTTGDNARKGDLYISIADQKHRQVLKIRSRKKYAVDKEMLSELKEWGVPFEIFTVEADR
ncbi:MAG: DNA polymerase III subunit alpha [Muribaculaceae bacterium]|nr:DNA polymerase III subunit alpha [Muribaculaceae bacterium]